ncbi:hypothetical protein L7F22_005185 [Adiantum nelumboides]|nr:hypothetical protein [Adiantum nelumboides]
MDLETPSEHEDERSHVCKFSFSVAHCTHVKGEDDIPPEDAFQSKKFDIKRVVNLVRHRDAALLKEFGNVGGLVGLLGSDSEKGISDDWHEIDIRKKQFGSNYFLRHPRFWSCVKLACQDTLLILLFLCGLATLGVKVKLGSWHDSLSILVVVLMSILLDSIVIYRQESQFSDIKEKARDLPKVNVTRGGRRMQVSLCDLVVGDIVHLKLGDQVPADGLFINGHSLCIDQSLLTGESEPIPVCPISPYILSGSKVCNGFGFMLVTNLEIPSIFDADGREETSLETRVRGGAICAGKVGLCVAFIVLVASFIHHFLNPKKRSGNLPCLNTTETVLEILGSILAFMVVVVPESFPLAVPYSLVHATKSMMVKNALARRLGACESMGHMTSLWIDETGILALNEMVATKAWVGGSMRDIATELKDMAHSHLTLLIEGILQNKEGGEPEVTGSATEKAVYLWGLQSGLNYKDAGAPSHILKIESFSSINRMAGVALQVVDTGKVHVHWKGAAEAVLDRCDKVAYPDGSIVEMNLAGRNELLRVIEGMAAESLHCIALSYMQFDDTVVHSAFENDKWTIPDKGMTLLAILGIKGPCRLEIPEVIRQWQGAGIKVRMITGHSLGTAKAIATNCGILKDGNLAVEGSTFQAACNSMARRTLSDLTVMAVSSPADKLLMVSTLKERGEVVAVVEGKDNGSLLLTFDVKNTAIAKENSDIIITDGDPTSILEAVRFARASYLNIKKIMQFQIADFLTAFLVNSISYLVTGDLTMTGAQLLWVNLIVVKLGVLALSREAPIHDILDKPPVRVIEPLMSNIMWRNLLLQVFYQVSVLLIVQYNDTVRLILKDAEANDVNQTILFNIYLLFQVFNLVNARKLEKINIFQGIASNRLLLGVVSCVIFLQVMLVEFSDKFGSTVKLSWHHWMICIGIGFLGWPIALLGKIIYVPKRLVLDGSYNSARQPSQRHDNVLAP